MCDHIWVQRNINPTLNGRNPKIAWVCHKCGIMKVSIISACGNKYNPLDLKFEVGNGRLL